MPRASAFRNVELPLIYSGVKKAVREDKTRQALESVRLYSPAELQAMAHEASLHLRRVLGTYAGEAFQKDSPRWIGIFEKA